MTEPVKFVFTGGDWKEYRGYVFMFGRPTTVADRGTIEALDRIPAFKRYVPPVDHLERNTHQRPILHRRRMQ